MKHEGRVEEGEMPKTRGVASEPELGPISAAGGPAR